MAKRPKLRMTNADYVAIAVSPALIMALVGSLVFFLIEVLYVGQYHGRLNYVFALFVFATVLIGRISIEMGTDRAALFALPLAIAMFLVLAKFMSHATPFSHAVNIGLLAIVWWSTHQLTWDCTLIDDNEDASGEGLMQRIGFDELNAETEPGNTENELLAESGAEKQKAPHTPGIWVLYFSLAALPLFGLGQKWIPVGDVVRRRYAFGLLTVYVASGLALLVTTSFLGLRRYLRQRHVEMPTTMAATWVAVGGVLIVTVMLLAALIPRPQAELALSQVPWNASSPSDLAPSQQSVGSDGTNRPPTEEDNNGRKVVGDATEPSATATREGDDPTTASEQAKQQSSGATGSDSSNRPTGKQSEQGESPGSNESRDPPPRSQPQSEPGEASTESSQQPPSAASESESASASESESADREDPAASEETPASASSSPQEAEQGAGDADTGSASDSFRPPQLPAGLSSLVGSLAGLMKLVFYAVVALALGTLAWRHRLQLAKAVADLLQQLRDLLARWFGGAPTQPTDVADSEAKQAGSPPPRRFASYPDPFANGQHHSMRPDELMRYTFEALEAWARERGFPRRPDQTPLELIRQAIPQQSALRTEAQKFARLYNEVAYAPDAASNVAVEDLSQFWKLLRQPSQTPLESATQLLDNQGVNELDATK